MPMRHSEVKKDEENTQYLYEWRLNGKWNRLGGTVANNLPAILPGSPEEFIFEHYWGYNMADKTSTFEYQVEHVRWNAGQVMDPIFDADIEKMYGKQFEPFLRVQPYSAFFAGGSEVVVRAARRIRQ